MYGTQTKQNRKPRFRLFENDVKMYGTQTSMTGSETLTTFENDVKMYGTQTITHIGRLSLWVNGR